MTHSVEIRLKKNLVDVMAVVVATDEEVSTPLVVRVAVVALAVEDAGPVDRKTTSS